MTDTAPIDLTQIGPGWEVETHAGARLKISRREGVGDSDLCDLWFDGYVGLQPYRIDGTVSGASSPHWMEIIRVHRPPLSEAERLAEIAKIASAAHPVGTGDWACALRDILALAEGREP